MTCEVWKESIPADGDSHVRAVGRIVHVAFQRHTNQVEVWFENHNPTRRRFRVFATGAPIPIGWEHVGTALTANGDLVWHLYEEVLF